MKRLNKKHRNRKSVELGESGPLVQYAVQHMAIKECANTVGNILLGRCIQSGVFWESGSDPVTNDATEPLLLGPTPHHGYPNPQFYFWGGSLAGCPFLAW